MTESKEIRRASISCTNRKQLQAIRNTILVTILDLLLIALHKKYPNEVFGTIERFNEDVEYIREHNK